MKIKLLLSVLLLLSAAGPVCAQFLDEPINLAGKVPKYQPQQLPTQEGYTLDLGKGNKLFIPRALSYPGSKSGLKLLQPVKSLLEATQRAYEQFRDSLQDPLTVKKLQYLSHNGQITTLINQKTSTGEKTYYTHEGKTAIIKPTMDSITIARVDSGSGQYRAAVMIFSMNNLKDFKNIASAALIDRFIDSIEAATPIEMAHKPYYKSFIYGQYHLNEENKIMGQLSARKNVQYVLSLGISADIQNIQNHFVPSASIGILLNNYYLKTKDTYHNFGLFWKPYFFFEKDLNGKTKTYRNDFIFATFNAYNGDHENRGGLDIFLPLSVGYLVHRKGEFLEKNTFGINAFGVKYGNATLKPYIYFHDFFKGVSPSIQLSIGIGQ